MSAVKKFNGLNGKVITRDEIIELIKKAKSEDQPSLIKRLEAVLQNYDSDKFEFEINDPEIETAPEALLQCFDCDDAVDDDATGLAKAVSPNDILNMITDRMVAMIKESKDSYQKKWKETSENSTSSFLIPINFVSKKPYRGINAMMLSNMGFPMKNPYYLTFKQIKDLKGKVKKGSNGREVIYYSKLYKVKDKDGNAVSSYDLQKVKEFADTNEISTDDIRSYALLRYYNVFNGDDVDGIDFKLEELKKGAVLKDVKGAESNKFPEAEALIASYPAKAPTIIFGGNKAVFYPKLDRVGVPVIEDFETTQDYYRTLFHELSHSTGVSKRLNRDLTGKFGSPAYAKEELTAEFGSVFLSAEVGIIWYNNKNHAAYLKNWNNALTLAADDNKFFISAATEAQKIHDFIVQYDDKGVPAYFADLKKFEKKIEVKKVAPKKVVLKNKPLLVGYMLLDSISGETVASKKTLSELKVAFDQLQENEIGKDLEVFVYEIIESSKGNTQGSRVLVDWKKATPVKITVPVKRIKKKQLVKVDKNGQTALFGARLNAPIVPVYAPTPVKSVGGIKSINDIGQTESQFFTVNGEVGHFLQAVEKKPVGSVVVTLDGMQGAGKTTTLYQFIEAFASSGNKCLFISGEEHPESYLAVEKRDKYLSTVAKSHTSIVGDVENTSELYEMIKHFDIIFIDSWQKLLRMIGDIKLDEDLRKKFNGKVFVVIFQQTTTGRTKGGAEVVFDGDIIIKLIKEASFSENYAYFDKNRYTKIPLENIRYNIADAKCYNPNESESDVEADLSPITLSFSVPEYSSNQSN